MSLIATSPLRRRPRSATIWNPIMGNNAWYHVSSHGAVLFCIAAHPDCTTSEVADALSLTRRTIWGIIGDLRRAGMLRVRKEGRRHHYSVDMDAELRLPFLKGHTLRAIVGRLPEQTGRREEGVLSTK